MNRKLLFATVGKYLSLILLLSILLFVPAGTLRFPNAWLLFAILFIPMLVTGTVLMIRKPGLLRKRIQTKEKEKGQKLLILSGDLMLICGFIVAGLNFRYRWLMLPKWLVITAAAVFLSAYLLYAEVLRENAYLSRIVEIQEDQKVIDTGLYGIVRHPMYASTILLFLSMPLVLGSFFSFLIFLTYPVIIVKRIKNEEQVLEKGLAGYAGYKKRIRYRLIPFVW